MSASQVQPVKKLPQMKGHASSSEAWVIYMEVSATILIALGVLLKMLAAHDYIPDSPLLTWVEDSFFIFQIPIYYLAFGYVFQHSWRITDGRMWARMVGRQLILCLTPFLFITVATLFVNAAIGADALSFGQLAQYIFTDPVSPVAFYPILLLMYMVTPTIHSKRSMWITLAIAAILKIVALSISMDGWPYILSGFCGSWIWFCIGAACSYHVHEINAEWQFLLRFLGTSNLYGDKPMRGNWILLGGIWLACSLIVIPLGIQGTDLADAILTLLGLLFTISMFADRYGSGRTSRIFTVTGKQTIGIFLLHPMCLSVAFYLFTKWHLTGAMQSVSAILGAFIAAFIVPMLILWVFNHVWKLGFLFKPAKYLPAIKQK